jgi:hypothetical protein
VFIVDREVSVSVTRFGWWRADFLVMAEHSKFLDITGFDSHRERWRGRMGSARHTFFVAAVTKFGSSQSDDRR